MLRGNFGIHAAGPRAARKTGIGPAPGKEISLQREKTPDYLRVFAMFAVIILHVSSTYVYADSSRTLWGMNAAMYLNQAARFSVPLFVLLSGMSFGMFQSGKGAAAFFKSRLTKILIPYILWALIYCFYQNRTLLIGVRPFFSALLSGGFASHLYFVPLVIQLYILAWPLRYLMKKRPGAVLIVCFAVSLCAQELLLLTCLGTELLSPGWLRWNLWRIFPTWLFYFSAGMYITRERLAHLSDTAARNLPWLLPVSLIAIVILALDSRATASVDLSIKPLIMFYTAVVFVTACGAAKKLERSKTVNTVVRRLAAVSYDVYLSHVLFLMLLRRLGGIFDGTVGMLLLFLAVTVCSLAFSLILGLIKGGFKKILKGRNTA